MAPTQDVVRRSTPRAASSGRVQGLVRLSGAAAVLEHAVAVEIGVRRPEGAIWLVATIVLLWLVSRRRSRVARGAVVVLSLCAATLYALGGTGAVPLLAPLCLAIALPLLLAPVREHVQQRR